MEEERMKKLFTLILILIAMVIFFVSCERDNDAILITLNVTNEKYVTSYTSAEVICNISSEASIQNVYLHYSTMQDFAEYNEVEMQGEEGLYRVQLTDLQDNTTYYVRYSASNRFSSIICENVMQLQTLAPSVPNIVFDSITTIWDTYAKTQFHLEFDGGTPITEMGICWGAQAVPVVETNKLETKDVVAKLEIKNLQPNTQYFVRAYAVNKIGIAYSKEYSFTTFSLPKVQTDEITEVQQTLVRLNGTLTFNGNDINTEKGFCWSEHANPTIDDSNISVRSDDNTFTYQLSNLNTETRYYSRTYAKNKIGITYGDVLSFTTLPAALAIVSTSPVENISYTSATIGGNISSDGGAKITERGVYIKGPDGKTEKLVSGKGSGNFTIQLSDLLVASQYSVRAYAINKVGIAYGEVIEFTTLKGQLPTVTISSPTNINYTSATIGGNVTSDGGTTVTERGIVFSTTKQPTTANNKVVSNKGVGSFVVNLSNLSSNTTYYVRAYAINGAGTNYSTELSFVTKEYTLPTIITLSPTNVSYTSATVGGNVTSNGGKEVTERGVYIKGPDGNSKKITSGKGSGNFTIALSNLLENTTYSIRAYAINEKGTAYGEIIDFTTKGKLIPIVTTAIPTNVLYTSAIVGGEVTSEGSSTITERGIYLKGPDGTVTKFALGKGLGKFSGELSNLLDSTIYSVRAYAINEHGTAYGEIIEFMTKGYLLPTVTTSTPTNITKESATVGGSVNNAGGTTVTERGVVYSTNQNPTTSNSKATSGSGPGAFSCSLSNLEAGTTYYVRAYAINKKGTAYGEQKSFTTKSYALPTVATVSATNITYTSATVSGNVINEGGANVTERGIIYATTPNPTTTNGKVMCGSGIGSFSCPLNNLQNGTTYYARAYAINAGGISYGEEISFTLQKYTLPEFDFTARYDFYSSSGQAYVECTITIINDGGTAITEIGVEYDKNIWWESNKCVKFNVNRDQSVYTTNIPYRDYVTNGNWTYYRGYVVNALGKKTSEYVWVGQ